MNSTHLNRRPTMTKPSYTFKQAWDDGDTILILITIISIIITEIGSCLTSQNSRSSIHKVTRPDTQSEPTSNTSTSNTKIQRSSPSTKRRSTTAVQRKGIGFIPQDIQSSPIASSTRSKPSKPTSNTSKSTRSKNSQALVSRRRTQTSTSVLPTTTQDSILLKNPIIADD